MLWTVIALALSAAAPPLEEDIDFQEGKRLVDELDYERAVFRFQKLTKSDRPAEQRAVVHAWLGLTYANLGDEGEAIKAFVVAIKLDPLVVLPPSSPKVAQTFDKARKIARDEVRADADGDGIPDGNDRCPNEPETKNGFEDDDGCKDEVKAAPVDGDGDGVADDVDTCKDVKGDAAHAGCPAPPPPPDGPPVLLIGGGVVAGLGVVAVVGGAVAGVLAQQNQDAAVAAAFQDEKQSLKESADGMALAANVGFGVGAALVVGGVVLAGASLIGGGP